MRWFLKTWSFLLFSFISVPFSHAASAATGGVACESKMVDTSHMPQQVQGDLEWCFAYSAANILSFYEKKRLSPYDVALLHHTHPKIVPSLTQRHLSYQPGDAGHAMLIAATNPQGVCLETGPREEVGHWQKRSEFFEKLLAADSATLHSLKCDLGAPEELKYLGDNVLNILEKLSPGKKAAAFLEVVCKKHRVSESTKGKKFLVSTATPETPTLPMDKIKEFISKSEPIAITYSIGALLPDSNDTGDNYHSSTVVGRKCNPKTCRCEYLVRDSFNQKDCSPKNTKIRCQGLDFWIDEKVLFEHLRSVNYLN